MNYVCLDLEYNKPTEVKTKYRQSKYIKNEIIEIGACKFTEDMKFVSGFKCYVKPYFQPKIDDHVLNLLGFESQEYINTNGTRFSNAIKLFQHFLGDEDFIFLVWGNNDLQVLKLNCSAYNINKDWLKSKKFINVQEKYMVYKNTNQQPSLQKVISELEILYEEANLHVAFYDSLNLGKIVQKLGKNFLYKSSDILYVTKTPFEISKKMKVKINCPKCGRFTKNDSVTESLKLGSNMARASKLTICNKCDIFIKTDFIYNKKDKRILDKKITYVHNKNKKHVNKFKEFSKENK